MSQTITATGEQDMPRQQRLYTITEAANGLGVCGRTVHHHVAKMGLGKMYGRVILLTTEDIKALRNRNKRVGRPPRKEK